LALSEVASKLAGTGTKTFGKMETEPAEERLGVRWVAVKLSLTGTSSDEAN
jgi:hypothetical protein